MQSAIYEGWVRHRRFTPAPHAFRYGLYMLLLDLDELDTVFAGRWLWSTRRPAPVRFRRADYLGDPAVPLAEAVRAEVARVTGRRPEGPVRLLTHLRTLGYGFNPISLYWCFTPDGRTVEAVVAEVSNTPWGQRHCYVLDAHGAGGRVLRFDFAKALHVSPFMPPDLRYALRMGVPGPRLTVHIDTRRAGARTFDATLALARREITGPNLARVLLRQPLMPVRVVAGIYWEALRLWLKGAPYHPHPAPSRPPHGETVS